MSRVLVSLTAAATLAASLSVSAQTPAARTDKFSSTIQGKTLDSTDHPLPNTLVRLRDARAGRIVGTQISDRAGAFTFRGVDPGSYIVEMVSADQQTVLATSPLININAADSVSAVVKLPFRAPPLAGLLGRTPASAALVTSVAAAAGVMATAVTAASASPQR